MDGRTPLDGLEVELHAEAWTRGKLEVAVDRLPRLVIVDELGFGLGMIAVVLEDYEVRDARGKVNVDGGGQRPWRRG